MVSLKAVGVVYMAANLLGVSAGLCRPSTRTSLSLSVTSASGSSTMSTSPDYTSSTDGTHSIHPTTSVNPTLSSSETAVSSSDSVTSSIPESSTIVISTKPTTFVSLTTSDDPTSSDTVVSSDSTTLAETTSSVEPSASSASTITADTTASIDTTTSVESMTTADTTTSIESTTSAESTTSIDPTTTAEITTTAYPTTSVDTTTTSSEPTTTTSLCVEPSNMLRQPGFEPSDDGTVWGFYWGGGGIENNPGEAKTGDYLAALPVPDGQERRMEQRISVVPNTEYSISFYYAVANPPSVDTQCFIFATFDYYSTLKQVSLPSDSEYHLYKTNFISADNLNPAVEIGVSCPGLGNGYTATVYIDDTSVLATANECDATPVDPNAPPKSTLLIPAQPEAPHCPVNVVQVPGFESSDGGQGWAFYGNNGDFVQDESNARTGQWEALFPSGTRSAAIYLEQYFDAQDLTAGETYDFHFFWKPKTLPNNGQCYMYGGYNDNTAFSYASINFGATSSTGYTLYSTRFTMPFGDLLLQIVFFCDYNSGNSELGSVYVDDTALIQVGGCEPYPATGALIENPSFEIQATDDSTYAWFGTKGVEIKAGSTDNGPVPDSGNNFLYAQVGSTEPTAFTKPLASALNAGQSYNLEFKWSAGPAYSPSSCSFKVVFGSLSQTIQLVDPITSYQYQPLEYSFTAAEAAESMVISVTCSSATDFTFDSFNLQ